MELSGALTISCSPLTYRYMLASFLYGGGLVGTMNASNPLVYFSRTPCDFWQFIPCRGAKGLSPSTNAV